MSTARSSRDRTRGDAVVSAPPSGADDQAPVPDVIRPWVPEAVLSRPKRGFGVPLRRWFQEQMIGWARDILLDPHTAQRGWTNTAEVRALLQQHENRSRDHAKRIWALVSLELWARQHVDGHSKMQQPQCA